MKLLRYGPAGQEKPAILDADGQVRDLSGHVADFAGAAVSLEALDAIRKIDISTLPVVANPGRIGACLASVPNFYCIGLNYAKHAAETGAEPPKEPIIFSKATSSLSGPFDPVVIPRNSVKADWEVELGVVIGREALYVSEADALSYVAGYCTINDVSEREFQIEKGGQWIKGKSAPTFGPTGPYLVTADEVGDPQKLGLTLSLNGEVVQDSNTDDMIFGVAKIISYMSQFMKLVPGDIIATGTPSGVGMGMKPQRFLKPGDVMEIEVKGLGAQKQTAEAAS
ncbi:MAG: 2-hydroxyhepta-2,4-diene-1,7-dioate isomerase [Rhodobacteraceae bacterium]|jgi:2-keto-4-pentenoate hydratase/2-oxohepta-3-ene-1,7-dioic acid hydratase in catechol pathway|uniref:fumarylacetoacetate hydrolase family protein n=1 Tax=Roseobacteraceae TaxID=2854170 RepID=UPI0019362756|nr:fumarylacetoacetate hydrolase family protein [Roseovarius sp. 10]MBE1290554.1 2-hydroxyhepta-2,4-diene-1,7-dioate isomerase [Paracoccaceae bacterium]MBF9022393.1 2-hydroxyhepta-2,4-diene-1,7-dioate isomerase [Rhodobacterales bacterium FZCC0069]MBF9028345.1 2-hydroxyhepta-2,4-diene-1,7-dioate isomerase [Rhodobacterales bacterium FZCC0188]MBF9053590.1 2-hydroxyhepta-2,4-diene-1,7-dioate isomerase [Rhodobacterales bacterium LSUCC1028]MBF9055496.1 2-hydroxyhepta-2,4-diene-1,7-dioate isomerase [